MSIHDAATVGNIEAVKQHLAASVDVDVKAESYDEWTPLHYAAYSSQKEVAELLIDKGADVNAKDKNGKTPLDWAVDSPYSDEETAALLRKHGGKTGEELKAAEPVAEAATPEPPTAKAPDISIHDAVEKGNIEAVKQHIAAGTDVNAIDDDWGMTLLYGAVVFGHKEIVELLIAEGADVNAKVEVGDYKGQTPLDLATTFRDRRTETADLLRKHGGKHGTIHSAVDGGDAEAVKEFLAAGADVNAKDGTGRTLLDWAHRGYLRDSPEVKAGKKETAALLGKHGGKTGEELKAEGK